MAGRGRPKKVVSEAVEPVQVTEEPIALGSTIRIVLRSERMIEEEDAKGRLTVVPRPWAQTVKYNGKVYKAGDEFECDATLGAELITSGQAQRAGSQLKPFTPKHIKKKDLILTSGVAKREDVIGKIPTYEAGLGNKGAWDYEEDLDL